MKVDLSSILVTVLLFGLSLFAYAKSCEANRKIIELDTEITCLKAKCAILNHKIMKLNYIFGLHDQPLKFFNKKDDMK